MCAMAGGLDPEAAREERVHPSDGACLCSPHVLQSRPRQRATTAARSRCSLTSFSRIAESIAFSTSRREKPNSGASRMSPCALRQRMAPTVTVSRRGNSSEVDATRCGVATFRCDRLTSTLDVVADEAIQSVQSCCSATGWTSEPAHVGGSGPSGTMPGRRRATDRVRVRPEAFDPPWVTQRLRARRSMPITVCAPGADIR